MKHFALLITITAALISCQPSAPFREEIRLTHDSSKNHDLDKNDNFSPDDKWLVYDTRTEEGGIGGCALIEKVNVETGEIVVMYELKDNKPYGPGAAAVSYSHTENKIVFIHGLFNCTEENQYQQWRRTGVMVDDAAPNVPIFMDARDVTEPFTPGALRGGTHRHEFSGDGKWVGFTYNDAIMKAYEDETGETWNLRTIGVSKRGMAVSVDDDGCGENNSGEWFSTLVVKVVPNPKPGSDEISKANGDSWVGTSGYKKPDGTNQVARAFIGALKDKDGNDVDEVFIVDIPEDITVAGENGPLEGTKTSFPMPPKGTVQRRLTYTAGTKYPGCSGILRGSPDGSMISYLAKDKNGIAQIFLISPNGGGPRLLTEHTTDVQEAPRWSPDGTTVCYVWDNSIVVCNVLDGQFDKRFEQLTKPSENLLGNLVWSHNGKMIAYNKLVKDEGQKEAFKQVYIVNL